MHTHETRTKIPRLTGWRRKLHEVIFEADTPAGKLFDVVLILAVFLSVAAIILESVETFELAWGVQLRVLEWSFTILFTLEYLLRLISVRKPQRYALSFFGIIDFLSVAPTYLTLVIPGTQIFLILRIFRLLRLFRVFKMVRYVREAKLLMLALKASRPKIIVFLFSVLAIVTIVGGAMYMVEGQSNPDFSNIPEGIYWAIVTVTTVGFGDVVPISSFGKVMASMLMITGYGMIAVPTGIVSVELARATGQEVSTQACPSCSKGGHDPDAIFCKFCSTRL